ASSKRDLQVNSETSFTAQTGQEQAIERQIQNINASRTMTLVFRQMNQQFVTLIHLVDVRVAFFNGYAESRDERPLYQLDELLKTWVRDDKVAEAKALIEQSVMQVWDHEDKKKEFVEQRKPDGDESAYLRVKRNLTQVYRMPNKGPSFTVPGVIVGACV